MNPVKASHRMKDLEIITDPNTIKVLFDKIRALIVFKYLVNEEMTVKQLADAIGKNPGNVLRHIERLKSVGLVQQVRTEKTTTGIVQRYYRATAREYRLGITGMIEANGGMRIYAKDRLRNMILGLEAYGVSIPEARLDDALVLLEQLFERENQISSELAIINAEFWNSLSTHQQEDASRLMRDVMVAQDKEYLKLKEKWSSFVMSFLETSS
ncbi:MAG: winged helix-turn-helix domain-containing protein [Candidatus Thorarchaeota archaeon]|jgi:DNA-binding transcriptional ArsR family regulator